ncbi:MAG: Elongation factor P [Chlamydiae bacterium]|nr:Elongation factor P [Chlamydiota bacterium]
MGQISANEFKAGLKLLIEGQPYTIVTNQFVKPGKGQAFNRVRIKNLLTGRSIEKTFKSGESFEEADVQEMQMRLLYTDNDGATFMDDDSFEQITVPQAKLEEVKSWLVEEILYEIVLYNGEPVTVEPPIFMEMEITETAPGVKGDTASGRVLKDAVIQTGAKIQIPIFIEQGEWVKVDTRTGEYVSRVTK